MSKYHALWEHIAKTPGPTLTLTFEEVEAMGGRPPGPLFPHIQKGACRLQLAGGKNFDEKRTVAFLKRQEPAASG